MTVFILKLSFSVIKLSSNKQNFLLIQLNNFPNHSSRIDNCGRLVTTWCQILFKNCHPSNPHKYWLFWVTVFSSNLSQPVTNLSQPVTKLSPNSPKSNGQAISKGDDSCAHSFTGLPICLILQLLQKCPRSRTIARIQPISLQKVG